VWCQKRPQRCAARITPRYHAFGVIGTALSKKISVFHSSFLKVAPISPHAPDAGLPQDPGRRLLLPQHRRRLRLRRQVRKLLGCLSYIHYSTPNSTDTKYMLVLYDASASAAAPTPTPRRPPCRRCVVRRRRTASGLAATPGAQERASPNFMGLLASLGLDTSLFSAIYYIAFSYSTPF
jgi:hypothetical protein